MLLIMTDVEVPHNHGVYDKRTIYILCAIEDTCALNLECHNGGRIFTSYRTVLNKSVTWGFGEIQRSPEMRIKSELLRLIIKTK